MGLPKVIIDPIGIDRQNLTRYDLYVEGVEGASCGYCFSLAEAEAHKDGIERAIKYSYNLGKNDGKHTQGGNH